MQLERGQTAVVTGGGSGIGLALAEGFADAGLNVVLADVDEAALDAAVSAVGARGVETLAVRCDVSREEEVARLAAVARERFGRVHVACNNAGVMSPADPWAGPLSAWQWVMGVNFWGVLHGVRAFLPQMAADGGGHIVNTASIAGLLPGFSPAYDASKHAVVAFTEDLFSYTKVNGLPVGVSVLCPGWVRTKILDASRNWPAELGEEPPQAVGSDLVKKYVGRAIDEGATPAAVAAAVLDAVRADRFWVLPHREFVDLCVDRWQMIADGADPVLVRELPGVALDELLEEMLGQLGQA